MLSLIEDIISIGVTGGYGTTTELTIMSLGPKAGVRLVRVIESPVLSRSGVVHGKVLVSCIRCSLEMLPRGSFEVLVAAGLAFAVVAFSFE